MIDLHSHILPGLDDGALDLADSIAMARVAAHDGIELVCATPHLRHDHDVRIGELPSRVDELNQALADESLATRVATGGEVAEPIVRGLDPDELRAASLGGGGRWILLEPAAGPLDDSLHAAVSWLGERGFSAVIAHPERHISPDFERRLAELAEAGCLIQATAAHLDGDGGEYLDDLFARGLLHVLGTDAHSSHGGRRLELAPALMHLADLPHLGWIANVAPAAIVAGQAIEPPVAPAPG